MGMEITGVAGNINSFSFLNKANTASQAGSRESGVSMRRLESEMRMKQKANNGVVGQSLGYADSLKATRTKEKETSLKLKKLRYSFKALSSQILRSKTSASARQAVGKARREVVRLKRQRQGGEYDEEELQAAITHAQAMERAAKKKLRHLQEEELVKVSDDAVLSAEDLEEREDKLQEGMLAKEEALRDMEGKQQAAGEEELKAQAEAMQEQMEIMQEQMQAMQEQMQEQIQREMEAAAEDMMAQMMEKMQDAMEEMVENLDLMDMATDIYAPAKEMTEEDFKMLRQKHRAEEMKALAKADSEYLKSMFDHYEKMKNSGTASSGGTSGSFGAGGNGITGGAVFVTGIAANVNPAGMPVSMSAGMPTGISIGTEGISIDVSI